MLPRCAIQPEGHWQLGPAANYSQGLRCGSFVFVSGQVDLDGSGRVCNAGDLSTQAANAVGYMGDILEGAGANLRDLVKLTVFYASDGGIREGDILDHLSVCLGRFDGPGPAVALIPLPVLALPGMEIEIEGIAMRDLNGPRLPRVAAWDPAVERRSDRDLWNTRSYKEVDKWREFADGRIPVKVHTKENRAQGRISDGQGLIPLAHGSFDNDIEVITAVLERIRGSELEAEVENLRGF